MSPAKGWYLSMLIKEKGVIRYYISQAFVADPKDASSAVAGAWQEIEQVIAHAASEILLDDGCHHCWHYRKRDRHIPIPGCTQYGKKDTARYCRLNDRSSGEWSYGGMVYASRCLGIAISPEVDLNIIRDIPMRMKRRGIENATCN